MGSRSVTAKDVAKAAGVSVATVSRVVNGSPLVSDKLARRVWSAIKRLNYRRNILARGLKTNQTSTVGIIVPNIMNTFFTAVVRGVEDRANQQGLNVILCNSDGNPDKEVEYLSVLLDRQVDGLILAPAAAPSRHLSEDIAERLSQVPVVFVDRRGWGDKRSVALVDNIQGAYCAVEHLISLGHRRIGVVTGPLDLTTGADRLEGYRLALVEHGISYDERLLRVADFKLEQAEARTMELLEEIPAPTALFVANNLMALGTLRAIRRKGLAVPDDIALVTFDDPEWAELIRPALTVVAQPTYDLGASAMGLLLDELSDESGCAREVVLKCSLLVRESCGARLTRRTGVTRDGGDDPLE